MTADRIATRVTTNLLPIRNKLAWWLMGCPFSRRVSWNVRVRGYDFGTNGWVPWDYRLGMRIS